MKFTSLAEFGGTRYLARHKPGMDQRGLIVSSHQGRMGSRLKGLSAQAQVYEAKAMHGIETRTILEI